MLSNCGIGEDSWEPLNSKEIKPANPKGNQLWLFTGRTDAEAPIFWPPDAKSWLIRKDPDAGKVLRQEEKKTTEDKMVGWHHQLHGHEFEQALGVGDGQGGLECCSSRGHKESDTTEQLNWTELKNILNCAYLSSPFSLSVIDLFTVSIVLLFPEFHILEINSMLAFSDWLISL